MIWSMVICAAISWGGCGVIHQTTFTTQEECERALGAVRFESPTQGNNGRSAFAYCRPGRLGDEQK